MNDYTITLFFHIVGALGFFTTLGVEWTGVRQIRSATSSTQVREWMRISKNTRNAGIASMLTLLASGIYMMVTVWSHANWIFVSFGALILVIVISLAFTGPRMAALGRALSTEKGALSSGAQHLARHPYLWISVQTRIGIALGIVFLMTVKPDLTVSLLTIIVGALLGLAAAMPISRPARMQEEASD